MFQFLRMKLPMLKILKNMKLTQLYLKAAQLFQRSRHKHTNVVSIHGCLLSAANTALVHSECCCFFCIVD